MAPGPSIDTVTLGLSVPVVISITTNTATWTSGALSASSSATVTVPTYNVTAAVNDPLRGSASCDPASVLFGGSSTCAATANADYVFIDWLNDCSGTDPVCTLSGIASDKLATANFAQAFSVAVNVDDPAGGSVTCEPLTVASGGQQCVHGDPQRRLPLQRMVWRLLRHESGLHLGERHSRPHRHGRTPSRRR